MMRLYLVVVILITSKDTLDVRLIAMLACCRIVVNVGL